jgi:hypothetical protein
VPLQGPFHQSANSRELPTLNAQPTNVKIEMSPMNRILAVLAASLLIPVGLPGYVVAGRAYASQHAFVSQHQRPIEMTAARGETMVLGVEIDNGVGGNWASPSGLDLVLDDVDVQLRVIAPKHQDWGDRLDVSSKYGLDSYDVTGSVTIPEAIPGPEERTLTGKLTGQLVYPSGGVLFTDYTEEVSIPVRIRLASQSSFRWSGGGLPFHGFAWADVALASVLVALAVIAVVRAGAARARRRAVAARATGGGTSLKQGAQLVGGGITAIVIIGGVLLGILSLAGGGAISSR